MASDKGAPRGRRHHDPELEIKLLEAEIFVEQTRLKRRLMADGWGRFERVPVRPRKERITVGFDAGSSCWRCSRRRSTPTATTTGGDGC
jgi:hypothetical protein